MQMGFVIAQTIYNASFLLAKLLCYIKAMYDICLIYTSVVLTTMTFESLSFTLWDCNCFIIISLDVLRMQFLILYCRCKYITMNVKVTESSSSCIIHMRYGIQKHECCILYYTKIKLCRCIFINILVLWICNSSVIISLHLVY